MTVDMNSLKPADDCPHRASPKGFTCDECGNTFQKPILARVSTNGDVQTYHACPRCMTKVRSVEVKKSEEKKTGIVPNASKEAQPATEGRDNCGHYFGYLNKRPKDTPIPETCMICPKIVECLFG